MNSVPKYPLTHPQKRIWYTEAVYPNTPMHNIGGAVRFKGIINPLWLEKAFQIFIQKNEGLRLQFEVDRETVSQYVAEYRESPGTSSGKRP